MGSLLEELERRESAARQRAEALREQIAELNQRLATEEDLALRLRITRETVTQVLAESGGEASEALPGASSGTPSQGGSPIGVLTVPSWRPGLEVSLLPRAYRDVLEVLGDAGGAMRAGRISAALGQGESAAKVEGLRGKLKRLVERGWLTEDTPGMFALTEQVAAQIVGQAGR